MSHILKQENGWRQRRNEKHILVHQLVAAINRTLVFLDMNALLTEATNLSTTTSAKTLAWWTTQQY
jgi:hypothetical protein